MPWEEFVAGVIVDRAIKGIEPHAKRVFEQKVRPMTKRLSRKTHGEQYLTLSSTKSILFYRDEKWVSESIVGRSYNLPLTFIIEPSTKGSIVHEHIRYELTKTPYEIPKRIAHYTGPMIQAVEKNKRYFNDDIVSLGELNRKNGCHNLILSPAKYYDSLATNFSMDYRPRNSESSLREFLHEKSGKFCEFNDSLLLNGVGVGCLVETADGFLVASYRGKSVSNWPGSLSISVNAVLRYIDVCSNPQSQQTESGTLLDIARCTFREGLEELGVHVQDLRFLGLLREFIRGGKPELYLYGSSALSLSEIQGILQGTEGKKTDEVRGIEGIEFHSDRVGSDDDSRASFSNRVVHALEQYGQGANLTLVTAIILAFRRFMKFSGK